MARRVNTEEESLAPSYRVIDIRCQQPHVYEILYDNFILLIITSILEVNQLPLLVPLFENLSLLCRVSDIETLITVPQWRSQQHTDR